MLYEASDYGKLVLLWPMAIIAKNKEVNSASSQFSFSALGQILTFLLRFLSHGVKPGFKKSRSIGAFHFISTGPVTYRLRFSLN